MDLRLQYTYMHRHCDQKPSGRFLWHLQHLAKPIRGVLCGNGEGVWVMWRWLWFLKRTTPPHRERKYNQNKSKSPCTKFNMLGKVDFFLHGIPWGSDCPLYLHNHPTKKAATLPVSTKGSASSSQTEGEKGEDNMLIQGKQRKTEGERCETWSI